MRIFSAFAAILMAATVSAAPARPSPAAPVQGLVVHVDDGDTIVVLTDQREKLKVRLANIDAPEVGHGRCRPGQPHGRRAGLRLAQLVKRQHVQLRCSDTDQYGRTVCEVVLGHTTANRVMVAEGFAWANRGGRGYVRDPEVYALEAHARRRAAGLWKDREQTAPWIWRRTEWMQPARGCGRGRS